MVLCNRISPSSIVMWLPASPRSRSDNGVNHCIVFCKYSTHYDTSTLPLNHASVNAGEVVVESTYSSTFALHLIKQPRQHGTNFRRIFCLRHHHLVSDKQRRYRRGPCVVRDLPIATVPSSSHVGGRP